MTMNESQPNNAGDGKDCEHEVQQDQKKVSFKPRPLVESQELPEPVESRSYLDQYVEQNTNSSSTSLGQIITGNVANADASKIGWILHYPGNTVLSPTMSEDEGTGLEWVTELHSEEHLFRVDTRWSVSIPEGTALIAYSPFNHVRDTGVSILPTMIDDRTSVDQTGCGDFSKIRIPLVLSQQTRVSNRDVCTQLVLVDEVSGHISSRALTPDEHQTVEKLDRAMGIYPDWYAENRDSRW